MPIYLPEYLTAAAEVNVAVQNFIIADTRRGSRFF